MPESNVTKKKHSYKTRHPLEQALAPPSPQEQEQEPEEEGVAVAIPTYFQMLTARDSGTALGTLALLCPTWITCKCTVGHPAV